MTNNLTPNVARMPQWLGQEGVNMLPGQALRAFIASRKKKNTQRSYLRDIEDFFEGSFPANDTYIFLERISPDHIQTWVNRLQAPVQDGGYAYSAATAQRKYGTLKSFLSWCVSRNVIPKNPATPQLIDPPTAGIWTPTTGLSMAHINALLMVCARDKNKLRGLRDLAWIHLAFTCCLRIGEVHNVSWVDFETVGEKIVLCVPDNKSGVLQKIDLAPKAQKWVERYLEALGGIDVAVKDLGRKGEVRIPIFLSLSNRSRHQRLTVRGLTKILENRASEAYIRGVKVHPHLLRHSGITRLFELKIEISKIRDHARHKDIKTTILYRDLWDKSQESLATDLADLVEEEFDGKLEKELEK